ncbi:E3 ubiquitin-protein ligase ZNRF1-like [Amphibalanus amphitrite]|uniref:E3 ubiquitin-protein ligase ZNRF1-like n=1 Tax=Amphibalanus amphitrite TaxID=1232801 RepID=UPI001C90EA0C|nr:E3 ubiquitin-protein ligase ZNRF1-like [Amphibalanus amphitrite]
MGAKPSTAQASPGGRERPYPSIDGSSAYYGGSPSSSAAGPSGSQSSSERARARSLSYVPDASTSESSGPTFGLGGVGSFLRGRSIDVGSQQANFNSLESLAENGGIGRFLGAHSLPGNLWSLSPNGIKCPVCNKFVLPDDVECHIVMCLTKPRISYNEDVLTEEKGECVICLEVLEQGHVIARLPCLCIYHKSCIDEWFQVNRTCPEHPGD